MFGMIMNTTQEVHVMLLESKRKENRDRQNECKVMFIF